MRSYYAVEEKRQGVRRGKCSLWLWASQLSFLGVISPRVKVGFGSGDGRALLEVSALMFSGSLATSSSPARGRTGPSHQFHDTGPSLKIGEGRTERSKTSSHLIGTNSPILRTFQKYLINIFRCD